MGNLDEHWCSKCREPLDKTKDQYTEISVLNEDKKKAKKRGQHTKILICKECLDSEEGAKDLIEKLRKHGNPNFTCLVNCQNAKVCKDYKPRNDKANCQNIYIIKDKIYCARRHPGATKLNQDKSMLAQEKLKLTRTFYANYMKSVLGEKKLNSLLKFMNCDNIPLSKLIKNPEEEIIVEEEKISETKAEKV